MSQTDRPRRLLQEALAGEPPRLDRVALAIAALGDPEVDPQRLLATLDELGDRVRRRQPDGSVRERLEALREVLGAEEGFRGDAEEYFAPENSFLDRVLERKRGLPITLSLLYVEVGLRAGLPMFGIPFPAHFLAGAQLEDGQRVGIDAFAGGRVLDEQGCQQLLDRVTPGAKFAPQLLVPASAKAIAWRMLNNLKRIYAERDEVERGLAVLELILTVEPDHPGELRARAMLYQKLGAFRAALADVEKVLALSAQAPDRVQLERLRRVLIDRVQLLN